MRTLLEKLAGNSCERRTSDALFWWLRRPLELLGHATAEEHPSLNKPYRAPKFYWAEEEIHDLYESMFDVWASADGTRRLSAKGEHRVLYWAFANAQAALLLDGDVVAGRDYALTEVVHCKSAREGFVKEARRPCVDRYLEQVLAISPAAVVFVVGQHAAHAVEQLDPSLSASRYAADVSVGRPGQCVRTSLAGRERVLAYLPHPGWLDRHPQDRARYELPKAFGPDVLEDLRTAVRRDEG